MTVLAIPPRIRAAAVAATVLLAGAGVVSPGAVLPVNAAAGAPQAAAPASGSPTPVVYDSDLDFDDASTLAYLCQADKRGRIDLRAVTVVNNGIGTAGRSLTHARTILDRCGLPEVPVADGSDTGVHPAPPEARELFERVLSGALGDGSVPDQPSPVSAPELIAATVGSSPRPVTVLATGPLTNVAAALRLRNGHRPDEVAGRIDRIYVMGGAFDVPGNLFGSTTGGFDNTQEVNMWIDPGAADEVFASMPARVRIVPLDATRHVPITPEFVDRLGAEADTYEARLVHSILTQPEMPELIGAGVMFWWDALAATSVVQGGDVVEYRVRTVDVVLDGESSGRTIDTPDGTPQRVGYTANQAGFEATFVAGLNGVCRQPVQGRQPSALARSCA